MPSRTKRVRGAVSIKRVETIVKREEKLLFPEITRRRSDTTGTLLQRTERFDPSLKSFLDMVPRSLATLLGLATLVSATSFPIVMQTNPTRNVIDSLDNFTLSAWNPSGNNHNATGVPLVLSITDSTAGSATHTWATWDLSPSNDWPSFTMTNEGIEANGPGRCVAVSAAGGSPVVFLTRSTPPQKVPAGIFCAAVGGSPNVTRPPLIVNSS
ncbi:hypothetical protein BJ322DRAFT_1064947 [Thelephora terrestris]|uniref:Uncharacterized protein n=1 Tax=Thelephora terrestris TaxID=56493 RepID=A0A9P6L6J8_9AGAM|nr:hypothetical protein BJ322DRAFT_1064947 [Thelephora terrestris]